MARTFIKSAHCSNQRTKEVRGISPGSHSTDAESVEDADQHLEKEDEEKDHEVDGAVVPEIRTKLLRLVRYMGAAWHRGSTFDSHPGLNPSFAEIFSL